MIWKSTNPPKTITTPHPRNVSRSKYLEKYIFFFFWIMYKSSCSIRSIVQLFEMMLISKLTYRCSPLISPLTPLTCPFKCPFVSPFVVPLVPLHEPIKVLFPLQWGSSSSSWKQTKVQIRYDSDNTENRKKIE